MKPYLLCLIVIVGLGCSNDDKFWQEYRAEIRAKNNLVEQYKRELDSLYKCKVITKYDTVNKFIVVGTLEEAKAIAIRQEGKRYVIVYKATTWKHYSDDEDGELHYVLPRSH